MKSVSKARLDVFHLVSRMINESVITFTDINASTKKDNLYLEYFEQNEELFEIKDKKIYPTKKLLGIKKQVFNL